MDDDNSYTNSKKKKKKNHSPIKETSGSVVTHLHDAINIVTKTRTEQSVDEDNSNFNTRKKKKKKSQRSILNEHETSSAAADVTHLDYASNIIAETRTEQSMDDDNIHSNFKKKKKKNRSLIKETSSADVTDLHDAINIVTKTRTEQSVDEDNSNFNTRKKKKRKSQRSTPNEHETSVAAADVTDLDYASNIITEMRTEQSMDDDNSHSNSKKKKTKNQRPTSNEKEISAAADVAELDDGMNIVAKTIINQSMHDSFSAIEQEIFVDSHAHCVQLPTSLQQDSDSVLESAAQSLWASPENKLKEREKKAKHFSDCSETDDRAYDKSSNGDSLKAFGNISSSSVTKKKRRKRMLFESCGPVRDTPNRWPECTNEEMENVCSANDSMPVKDVSNTIDSVTNCVDNVRQHTELWSSIDRVPVKGTDNELRDGDNLDQGSDEDHQNENTRHNGDDVKKLDDQIESESSLSVVPFEYFLAEVGNNTVAEQCEINNTVKIYKPPKKRRSKQSTVDAVQENIVQKRKRRSSTSTEQNIRKKSKINDESGTSATSLLNDSLVSVPNNDDGDNNSHCSDVMDDPAEKHRSQRPKRKRRINCDELTPFVEFHTENIASSGHWREKCKEMDANGIQYYVGRWSEEETKQLNENWREILKDCPFSPPHLLLMRNHSKELQKAIYNYIKSTYFYIRLGENIRRTLYSIYRRARTLFLPGSHLGRFSEKEDNLLKKEIQRRGRVFHAMAEDLGRSGTALASRSRVFIPCLKHGSWTGKENKRLSMAVKEFFDSGASQSQTQSQSSGTANDAVSVSNTSEAVASSDKIAPNETNGSLILPDEELSNASEYYSLPWERIARIVETRTAIQCRVHWLFTIRRPSSDPDSRLSSVPITDIIRQIILQQVESEKKIDWVKIKDNLDKNLVPQYYQRRWHRRKAKIPRYKSKSFSEILDIVSEDMIKKDERSRQEQGLVQDGHHPQEKKQQ